MEAWVAAAATVLAAALAALGAVLSGLKRIRSVEDVERVRQLLPESTAKEVVALDVQKLAVQEVLSRHPVTRAYLIATRVNTTLLVAVYAALVVLSLAAPLGWLLGTSSDRPLSERLIRIALVLVPGLAYALWQLLALRRYFNNATTTALRKELLRLDEQIRRALED